MTFTQYQIDAVGFRLPSSDATYALLNLPGEVGELLSLEAKMIRDGGNIGTHLENIKKELGDILWCVSAIARDNGFDLAEVAQGNIDKLTRRKANNTIKGSGDDR